MKKLWSLDIPGLPLRAFQPRLGGMCLYGGESYSDDGPGGSDTRDEGLSYSDVYGGSSDSGSGGGTTKGDYGFAVFEAIDKVESGQPLNSVDVAALQSAGLGNMAQEALDRQAEIAYQEQAQRDLAAVQDRFIAGFDYIPTGTVALPPNVDEIAYQEQVQRDLAAAHALSKIESGDSLSINDLQALADSGRGGMLLDSGRSVSQELYQEKTIDYENRLGEAFSQAINRGQTFESALSYAQRVAGAAPTPPDLIQQDVEDRVEAEDLEPITEEEVKDLPAETVGAAQTSPEQVLDPAEEAYLNAYTAAISAGASAADARAAGDRAYETFINDISFGTSSGVAQEISPPDLSGRMPDDLDDFVSEVAARAYEEAYNASIGRGASPAEADAAGEHAMLSAYRGAVGSGTVSPGEREEADVGYVGGPLDELGDVSNLDASRPSYEVERGETSGLSSADRAALYGDDGYGEAYVDLSGLSAGQPAYDRYRGTVFEDVTRPSGGGIATVDTGVEEPFGPAPEGFTGPPDDRTGAPPEGFTGPPEYLSEEAANRPARETGWLVDDQGRTYYVDDRGVRMSPAGVALDPEEERWGSTPAREPGTLPTGLPQQGSSMQDIANKEQQEGGVPGWDPFGTGEVLSGGTPFGPPIEGLGLLPQEFEEMRLQAALAGGQLGLSMGDIALKDFEDRLSYEPTGQAGASGWTPDTMPREGDPGFVGPLPSGQLGLSMGDIALKDREDRLSYEPTGQAGASGWTPDTMPREGDPGFVGAVQPSGGALPSGAAGSDSGALPDASQGSLTTTVPGNLGTDVFQAMDAISKGQAMSQNLSFLVEKGYGATEGLNPNNPTQSVQEMLNAARLDNFLQSNMGTIAGMTMGPAAQMLVEAAMALNRGHKPSSVIGMIASSIIGSAIEMVTGVRVPGSAIQDLANGNVGKAAFGVGVSNVAARMGLPVATVNAALRGDLGSAMANQVLTEVVVESSKQLGADPALVSLVASKTGVAESAFGKLASAINNNEIVKEINDVVGDWTGRLTGIRADTADESTQPAGGAPLGGSTGDSYSSDGSGDSSSGDATGGALPGSGASSVVKKRLPNWSTLFFSNLARDLGTAFSMKPSPETLPNEDLEQSMLIAQAYGDPSRSLDLLFEGDKDFMNTLDGKAIIEYAALEAGRNSYQYEGKTYEAKKENIEAYADGRILAEYTRLVNGALESKGVDPFAISDVQRKTLADAVYREYGNDINRLKAASIQDVVNGNTATLSSIISNKNPYRVDINVRFVGDWSPSESKQTAEQYLPIATRLATQEEFDSGKSTQIMLPDGFAWVVSKDEKDFQIPGYTFEQLQGQDPWTQDPESALLTYAQFDTKQDGGAQDLVINSAKAAVDLIQNIESGTGGAISITPEGKAKLIDVLATTASSGGELVKTFSDLIWSTGLVDRDNTAGATARALINYADGILSADAQKQQKNIMDAIDGASTLSGKYSALIEASKANPWGAALIAGGELVQEVPSLLAGGAVGKFVAGIWGKAIGFAAARGADSVLGAAESAGQAYGETYDNIIKAGGSEDYAAAQAAKSAFQSAAVTFGADLMGDAALVRKFMGDMKDVSLSFVTKEGARQFITEGADEFLQNLSTQYNSYGSVDMNQAMNAFTIGSVLGPAVSTGLLAPGAINYSVYAALDMDGRPVTLQQALDGSVRVAPGSFNVNAITADVAGSQVTFGDLEKVVDTSFRDPSFSVDEYKANLGYLAGINYDGGNKSDVAMAIASSPNLTSLADNLQELGVDFDTALNIANIKYGDQVVTRGESSGLTGSGTVLQVDPQTGYALVELPNGELTVVSDPSAQVGATVTFGLPPDTGTVDPGTVDPGTVDPGVVDPGVVDPGTVDPGTVDSGVVDPGTVDPGVVDPGTVDPGTVDSGVVDPGVVDPGVVDPGTVDPGTVDPGAGGQTPTGTTSQLTMQDVQKVVQDAMAANPSLTEQQVQQIVSQALQGLPAGLTSADVSAAISSAIAGLPQAPTAQDVDAAVSRAMTNVATQEDVRSAIAGIQFPAGISEADVTKAISDYMKANPGLSAQDVAGQVADQLSKLPTYATPEDVTSAINSALTDVATKTDVADAIAGIQFPAGITTQDVTKVISDYMQANPGLSAADVATQVSDQLAKLPQFATPADVEAAIGSALTSVATKTDVANAIAGIQFPAGISQADVTKAITDYMQANPGLSASDVAGQVADQLSKLPTYATPGDVTSAINDALTSVATKTDVATAIAGIQFPAGITPQDVTDAITQYMQQNPGLSASDVATQVSDQIAKLPAYATPADVTSAVNTALVGVATQADVANAIAGIQFPDGITPEDVTKAITDYMQANPGLSAEDVAGQVADQLSKLPTYATPADVQAAINGALTSVATKTDVANAIAGIQFPVGISSTDVTKAITDYMQANPGLSSQDVAQQVADQLKTLPAYATPADVEAAIGSALTDVATKGDVAAAIAGIQFPAGITPEDVTNAITDYMQANPGLSAADVADQVSDELAKLPSYATPADVTAAINGAMADVATKTDVANAIAGIQFPEGITPEDVTSAITEYMKANPGLSAADVAAQVAGQLATLPAFATPGDIQQTQQSIADVEGRINQRVGELMQQGVDYQTATTTAIGEVKNSLSSLSEQTSKSLSDLGSAFELSMQQSIDAQAASDLATLEWLQRLEAQQAAEAEAQRLAAEEEARKQEERAKAQLAQQQQQQMLSTASGFMAQGRGSGVSDPYKATFKDPFIVGGEAKEFQSPLAGFIKGATNEGFLPSAQPNEAKADSGQAEYFNSGEAFGLKSPLEIYNPTADYQGLYGFRQGGLVPAFAQGGTRHGNNAHGALRVLEHSGKLRADYRQGDAVTGIGDGQSDDIPAMLADGEFVIPADVVAALGNGSTKAGSDKLYEMMHNIRRHHRSAGPKDLPPPAKSPLEYIKPRRRAS